jgi:hypothetical protein
LGAGSSRLGYSGPTNALCIDLDPEAGRLGSLRSLQSSLHLLRCDVSRGVAQLRPLLDILAQHLARTEPHVEVTDDDIEECTTKDGPASRETVRDWERDSLPAELRQEESAIRQALFDALMELLPLAECRHCGTKGALDTVFRSMQLAKAEIQQAARPGVVYGGVLFFVFAVEQLRRYGVCSLVSAVTADSRKRLLNELVELSETMSDSGLADDHEVQMTQAIGSTIDFVARCDMTGSDLAPNDVLRGSTAQARLMPLAEELYLAVFACGNRSSPKSEDVAKWLPTQQRFITSLQKSCPLLVVLVLDRRLSPVSRMQHLWSRLACWEHVAMSDKLRQFMSEESVIVDGREFNPVVGHMWMLASLYSAALELVCDSSSLWTVDEVKQCIADERNQGVKSAQCPFENPARPCDELIRGIGWTKQCAAGTRLKIAVESIHAAMLHA